jgi:hypothetical protein
MTPVLPPGRDPDLFDELPEAPFSRPGTSEAAAASVDCTGMAATRRAAIMKLAIQRGRLGLTCHEAEVILNLTLNQNGTHPRFWELEKMGVLFVIDGITRPTNTRRQAQVYFASQVVTSDEIRQHYGLRSS